MLPSRLQPVPARDACLSTLSGSSLLAFQIPPYARDLPSTATHLKRRESLHKDHRTVRASCIYPIIPDLRVDPLPRSLWTSPRHHWVSLWVQAMHGAGYEPCPVDYAELVGETAELGIFGRTRNPLRCVVDLACKLNKPQVLLHYVAAVVLQYYLAENDLFLRARTDAGAPFSEALPPFLFLMFRVDHWKVQDGETEPSVHTQSFPTFLFLVLRWIQRAYPAAATLTQYGAEKDHVALFCAEKLRKNFLQALMCMRFREAVPTNTCARVNESWPGAGATDCLIKFFPHPKMGLVRTLDTTDTPAVVSERIPMFFTHMFFTPIEPLFVEPNEQVDASALWKLLLFHPLSDFDKCVTSAARRIWGSALPPAPGPGDINPVRARYSFYVRGEVPYVLVPNLLLPEGAPPHDETSVLAMSTMAWEWLSNNGRRLDVATETEWTRYVKPEGAHWRPLGSIWYNSQKVDPLPPYEVETVWSQLSLGPKLNPYWYFWSVKRITQSEAHAVATVSRLFTLEQVQAHYRVFASQIHQAVKEHLSAPLLTQMKAQWDRCTNGSVPLCDLDPHTQVYLRLAWNVLFPPSVIAFGAEPWVAQWKKAEAAPLLMQAVAACKTLLSRGALVNELSHLDDIENTPAHRAALQTFVRLTQLFPADMPDATALLAKAERLANEMSD